jgi:hypothetical protein
MKKWEREFTRDFSKEQVIQTASKYTRKHSTSLAVREIQKSKLHYDFFTPQLEWAYSGAKAVTNAGEDTVK